MNLPQSSKGTQTTRQADDESELLSLLRNGVHKRRSAMQNVRWQFTEVGRSPNDPRQSVRQFDVLLSGRSIEVRCRTEPANGPDYNQSSVIVYDAQHSVEWNWLLMDRHLKTGDRSGVVMSKELFTHSGHSHAILVEYSSWGVSTYVDELLSADTHVRTVDRIGQLIRVTARRASAPDYAESIFLFNPDRDFVVTQAIWRQGLRPDGGEHLRHELVVSAFTRTTGGRVVPEQARVSAYQTTEPGAEPQLLGAFDYNVVSVDDAIEVRPGRFAAKFPTGTAVHDGIHNLSFIAGKAVVVADTDGTHYHTSLDAFPFLHDYTDPHTGMTDEQWNASPQKRMVEETWADIIDGKIVPRSAGARPVSAAAPAPLATERGYGPTVLLIGALMAASAAAVVLLRARGKSAA